MSRYVPYVVVCLLILATVSIGQSPCTGAQVFGEKDCDGDGISEPEKALHEVLTKYRDANGRSGGKLSENLSKLANRHLLDVRFNIKKFTHGWSNCPYDPNNRATWPCMTESAKRLRVDFEGRTFETLFATSQAVADGNEALESWKRSTLHNSIILNRGSFANMKWDEIGVSISGNYAALWFGSKGDLGSTGIGATYEQAVAGLTKLVPTKPLGRGQNRWTGTSRDGKISIDLTGPRTDLSEAIMSVSATVDANGQLSPSNRAALSKLLRNIFSEWDDAQEWLDSSLKRLAEKPSDSRTKIVRNTLVNIAVNGTAIRLLFTPENSMRAREIK